jgi:Ca-activated chloride channel homolog
MANDEFDLLRNGPVPTPREAARERALDAALSAYDLQNTSAAPQGSESGNRLTERAWRLWSEMMNKKMYATPAIAGLLALPIAGYTTYYMMQDSPFAFGPDKKIGETTEKQGDVSTRERTDLSVAKPARTEQLKDKKADDESELGRDVTTDMLAKENAPKTEAEATTAPEQDQDAARNIAPAEPMSTVAPATVAPGDVAGLAAGGKSRDGRAQGMAETKLTAEGYTSPAPLPADQPVPQEENRDRVEEFKTNPIHATAEDPVSTFSIDVDTASYSFARRSLKEGYLPQADTVRVEEMINYFPYDWKGPDSAATPFNTTVSVMPTPWNANTKLMHVAIKGYDVKATEKPKANLVFLIDVSGSMDEQDKLPLLKSAFRLLVDKLGPDDTVSIVTYAGDAGTVLMPTKATDKSKILSAIDNLSPGGTTAGEAGIREAYKLAQQSFVAGGVNRVMLATDGDFNVGQTDDDDLKRLIEKERQTGVFLSVFGFGRGNLNDEMMQTIAQNGNGTAAYIDTLAEAEKVLVEDASSTLFTIAKDVKIQVEFNPAKVAEYRLIGYETRALNREDFNNDRVDAGEIGSGHSVTAIYEITPKGSPSTMIDDLRYGEATVDNGGVANADEYAFVKIRYKAPDGDVSKLITTPVTEANAVASFDQASVDQRFSIAVAAFGQKLRNSDQTAKFGYDKIIEIATAARGSDPFGYRAEFLSLVRLASALDTGNR